MAVERRWGKTAMTCYEDRTSDVVNPIRKMRNDEGNLSKDGKIENVRAVEFQLVSGLHVDS